MSKRNVCETKREMWNVFKACENYMWEQNAKVSEIEKMLVALQRINDQFWWLYKWKQNTA